MIFGDFKRNGEKQYAVARNGGCLKIGQKLFISRQLLTPLIEKNMFHDALLDKQYVFTTNRFDWPASLVAQIYKQRWQVELFFKWIKQNLKLKCFVGLSNNAVMTQIMVAMCAYLLMAYLKFSAKFTQSLQQMIRLIRVNLFIRRSLTELFQPPDKTSAMSPQLGLFYA